jgi:CheY-like chemotaxis protein
MVLPDLNGYEIIGRMSSEKELANIPILAVSGYAEKLKELDKIEVPEDRLAIPKLIKPVEPALLAKTVKDILRQYS